MRNIGTASICSALIVSAVAGTSLELGAGYEVPRYALVPGGSSRNATSDYEVFGAVGQPESGVVMTGSSFAFTGGFLFALDPADCNADGAVTFVDHAAFTSCLSGPDSASPTSDCRCFDVDRSGAVDLGDFADLQLVFSSP